MRIRSLVLAAALTIPALSHAQTKPPPAPAPAPKPPPSAEQAPSAADKAKEEKEMAAAEKRLMESFKGQDNFKLEGKLLGADAENGSILLQRDDMPMALLIVPDSANVSVNGKKSSLSDLQPGADVRATFNLAQQYPIALEVNATQSGTKPNPEAPKRAPGEPPAPPTPPKSK